MNNGRINRHSSRCGSEIPKQERHQRDDQIEDGRMNRDAVNQEKLLLSFDQLASPSALVVADAQDTKSALKSIESLLLHISLPQGQVNGDELVPFPDPNSNRLFAWYYKLQDSFQTNVAQQLIVFLQRIADGTERTHTQAFVLLAMDLLQGALLLHSPSRKLFRTSIMTMLLTFLESWSPEIYVQAIQTLVCACVDAPENLRTFEKVGGFDVVSRIFMDVKTEVRVKYKVLEFLYFYLIPETDGTTDTMRTSETAIYYPLDDGTIRPGDVKHAREPAHDSKDAKDTVIDAKLEQVSTRTVDEKQELLGRYFTNIDKLVEDLKVYKPFGDI